MKPPNLFVKIRLLYDHERQVFDLLKPHDGIHTTNMWPLGERE